MTARIASLGAGRMGRGIAVVFAAIAYGVAHLLFRLVQSW